LEILGWRLVAGRQELNPGNPVPIERTRELLRRFKQRRARKRPLPCLVPQARRLLDQASFGAMARQQLRLVLGKLLWQQCSASSSFGLVFCTPTGQGFHG
jgi:hypothetical protein